MSHTASHGFAGSPRSFPTNHVIGAMDHLQQAQEAVQALQNIGYPAKDIVLISSQTFIDALQRVRRETGRVTQALHVFSNSSDEGFPGDLYLEESRRGRQVLSVYATRADQAQEIAQVLSQFDLHVLRYFGPLTVTAFPSR